jgi:hypothetical protein
MISGEVLKWRKGERVVIPKRNETTLPCSSQFLLTLPFFALPVTFIAAP